MVSGVSGPTLEHVYFHEWVTNYINGKLVIFVYLKAYDTRNWVKKKEQENKQDL
jgi:hypothetical protein